MMCMCVMINNKQAQLFKIRYIRKGAVGEQHLVEIAARISIAHSCDHVYVLCVCVRACEPVCVQWQPLIQTHTDTHNTYNNLHGWARANLQCSQQSTANCYIHNLNEWLILSEKLFLFFLFVCVCVSMCPRVFLCRFWFELIIG